MNPRVKKILALLAVPAVAAAMAFMLLSAGYGEPAAGAPPKTGPAPAAMPAGKLTPPTKPLRAVQVMSFDCDSWAEVDARLDQLAGAGVKAIILRVFQNQDDGFYQFVEHKAAEGVYFQTKQVPVVADVLGPVCEMAHRKGLLVMAWMTTRYADYGHENDTGLRCMAWDFAKKRAVPKKGYCPLIPEAQDRICAIYRDLARYPIDGVLLQDDLVLKHTEGMNQRARELYFQATGKQADPAAFYKNVHKLKGGSYAVGEYTPEFHDWSCWKNQGLLLLAERVRRTIHASKPNTPVGLNLFYETLTDPEHALPWYSQDLDQTLASDLDFYAFMLYHRQMADELKLPRKEVFDLIDKSLAGLVRKVDYPQRILVKVQSVDWNNGARIPAAEISELLALAKRSGPVGLVVIPTPRSLDLDRLRKSFK